MATLADSPAPALRGMVYAAVFGAATAAGAYIMIPIPPVPVTLQTLFMALAAVLLGGRWGAASQGIYIVLGLMGLPVFAGGKAGLGVLFGPTGGYLVGFVAGAYVTGRLMEAASRPGPFRTAAAVSAGYVVVYTLGVAGLCLVGGLGIRAALPAGVLPFLPGDVLKAAAVALIAPRIREHVSFFPRGGGG
ncbi:MAG: biotin transporter BioY [Desulfobacteraceae bacterium]